MDNQSPSPNFELWPYIVAGVGAVGFILKSWLSKANPWPLLQRAAFSLNKPMMEAYFTPFREEVRAEIGGLKDSVHKLQRVVVKTQGGEEALEKVNAEDAAAKRW